MKWKLEVNHKILIRLLVVLILLVIGYGIECAFFKPTALNRYIASNIYKTPANSAFHDDKFYQCVVDRYNSDNHTSIPYTTSLTDSQLEKIKKLSCRRKSITDASGLEKLIALTGLAVSGNQLTNIDVSKNTSLTYLEAENNQLTNIDVSKNTALENLYVYSNQLTNLDVSNNTALTVLNVNDNQLANVDVSKNTALEYLYVSMNKLTNLDVSNNTALTVLNVNDNQLANLDISKNTALTDLDVNDNQLTNIDVSKNTALKNLVVRNNQLTNLDVSKNTALTYLDVSENQLTNLDVSKNTALAYLSVHSNQLINLIVNSVTALTELVAYNNQLTNIDVSKNTALKILYVYNNQLTNLDVSKNTALGSLHVYNNQLTNLDVSKNTALVYLSVYSNQLTNLDVSKNTVLKKLYVYNNQLTNLDVSKNTALTELDVYNNQLTNLYVSNNTALTKLSVFSNQLTNLDVSNNTALTSLYVSSNQLTNLDVGKNTALTDLDVRNNQLTNIDVSNNTALTSLYVSSNQLTNLDVSKNTALKILHVSSNQLTNIDVSNNTALTQLYVDNNQLTNLDVSKNTALTSLYVPSNQLTNLDLSNNLKLSIGIIYSNPFSIKISILLNSHFNLNFDKAVKLPPQISVEEEFETISDGLQKNDDGFVGIKTGTQSIKKVNKYNVSSYTETYIIEVVDVKSDKYLIDKNSDYLIVGGESDEEILKNIVVENGTAEIEGKNLIIKCGDDVVHTFFLVKLLSDKYDFGKNYVYVGSDSDSEVLNNITLENGIRAKIEANKLSIIHDKAGEIASFDLVRSQSSLYDLDHDYIYLENASENTILNHIEVINGTAAIEENALVIKYQDEVVKKYDLVWVRSDKYDMSQKSFYVGIESNDDILNSIEVINGTVVVDGTELVIKHGNDVVKRYGLIQTKSSKYDMSKSYIYVGQDSNDVIMNNIEVNADIFIDDNRDILSISYQNNVVMTYRLIRLKTKYDLSNHYLYTLDDNILDNIGSSYYVRIEDNRLVVRGGEDEILDVFPILTLTSDDYIITNDYLYSGYRNLELDKIHLINVDGVVEDEYLNISYQGKTLQKLPIYHLQSNHIIRFKNDLLYIKDSMDYKSFINNVTFNTTNESLKAEVYRGENKVTTGNVIEGDTLKVFYQDKEVDSYTVGYRNEYVFYDDNANVMQTDTYGIDILKNLRINDTFSEVKKLIETDGVISIKDKNNQVLEDSHLIKTGDRMEISFTSANPYLIYLSIRGDVTGSGSISDEDVLKSYQILRGEKVDKYVEVSSDVVRDGVIKINDVAKLHQYVKKKINSLD